MQQLSGPVQRLCGCPRRDNASQRSLADGDLRYKRIVAHRAFDRIWKNHVMSRSEAYGWLAFKLGIEPGKPILGIFRITIVNGPWQSVRSSGIAVIRRKRHRDAGEEATGCA